jgi:hypothetical protein
MPSQSNMLPTLTPPPMIPQLPLTPPFPLTPLSSMRAPKLSPVRLKRKSAGAKHGKRGYAQMKRRDSASVMPTRIGTAHNMPAI